MSDNKDFEQQDFIDQGDEFAEIMEDNFDATNDPVSEDHIIDIDAVEEPFMTDNEWEEDFTEEEFSQDDPDLQQYTQKSDKNWFNIIVFGIAGVAVCAMMYVYLPGILGGGQTTASNAPQAGMAVQNQDLTRATSPEQNALLAGAALSNDASLSNEPSLLDNPDIVGGGVASIERPDPEAEENELFNAIGNVPTIADKDIDNIFDALENVTIENNSPNVQSQNTPALPTAYDEQIVTEDIFDEASQQPRAPLNSDDSILSMSDETMERGVAQLADAVVTPQQEQETVQAESVDNAMTPTPVSPTVANEEISKINSRMDQIMERLDALAQTVETMADNEPVLSAAAPAPTQNNADVERLERTIAGLEKKIATLSDTKKAPVKSTAKTTSSSTPKKTVQKSAPKPRTQWELRGASPTEAYVAEKGTQNLRTVGIGDTLDGVGRITSIAVEGNQWVVRGTSGRITQ